MSGVTFHYTRLQHFVSGNFRRISQRADPTPRVEIWASKMQPKCWKSAGGVGPSQVGLIPEEEHGLRAKDQELHRGSKGVDSQRNDGTKFNEIHRRSCRWNRGSKTEDERLAWNHRNLFKVNLSSGLKTQCHIFCPDPNVGHLNNGLVNTQMV